VSPSWSADGVRRSTRWARQNLFSSPWNALLTVAVVAVIGLVLPPLFRWAVTDATLNGLSRRDCTGDGACWAFIRVRLDLFFYGLYPAPERWRVHVAFALVAVAAIATLRTEGRLQLVLAGALLSLVPVLAGTILVGGVLGLAFVPTNAWGGLMLNVLLTVVASVGGFILGVGLAYGRRSSLPMARGLSIAFIDLWRGVPLLTVLFMAMLLMPLFMPRGVTVDNLVRAMIALTLFTAAYMAEIVRGGLQAVPRGQGEAASSLGLHPLAVQLLIVLPQALRLVIPGLVNTVIDLFKDTTLVSIVGLFDLLGIVGQASKDQAWLGMAREGYAFAAAVFFVCCLLMSLGSRGIERSLTHRERRPARRKPSRARSGSATNLEAHAHP